MLTNRYTLFLKEVRSEMSKVSWPTRQETVRLTEIVIGASIVVALFIGSLDFVFTKLMELLIKK